ncbi:hypothetical protein P167DRAFT_538814 [Morchella conica CCBAS932]|uniref:DNA replication factor Cdt1 C-terminal domain-containing protein n=1 Tax=Morchella conica CCBAS932 TaxID=1392247 RepID=A0A3N4KTD2_9PEZI|nr:hypothetical protein P167DRAFT_538814 [Morchella conica CCBAS932]
MPLKRKVAAAAAVKTQTLHSFSTVGKNIPRPGKLAGKAGSITETKKKEQTKDTVASVPAFEIRQDGDEDVVVKREEPTKVDLAPPVESVKPSPAKVKQAKFKQAKVELAKVELAEIEQAKAESTEVTPAKAKPTKPQPAKVIGSAKKSKAHRSPSPPAATPGGGKRKRTLLDDYISTPAKKREISPHESTDFPPPPAASSPALPDDPPTSASATPTKLPPDLILLQSLHSSLLTALLLHRAHHSNSIQPPVFSAIKLHVERLCRRNITLEDVRRIVYLSHYSPGAEGSEEHFNTEGGLKLIDYGSNKICIDFVEKTKARKLTNTDILKKDFLSRTQSFLDESNKAQTALPTPPSSFIEPLSKDEGTEVSPNVEDKETNSKEDGDRLRTEEDEAKSEIKEEGEESEEGEEGNATPAPLAPVLTIPLAKIHAHHRAKTISKVLHSKGQQRLDDLLKRSKPALLSSPVKAKTVGAPVVRGDSLLSRIRAKAEAAALEAAKAPSKEEQERDAARQRIPDIEPILKGLAGRGSNMTMKSVVEGIRESVRNPVSSEQAEMAVRLIAEREGVDGWVKVRQAGKVVGVVFGKRREDGEFL